jgi:hypothetical protein
VPTHARGTELPFDVSLRIDEQHAAVVDISDGHGAVAQYVRVIRRLEIPPRRTPSVDVSEVPLQLPVREGHDLDRLLTPWVVTIAEGSGLNKVSSSNENGIRGVVPGRS